MLDLQIKSCNMQIEFLIENKPSWFQKKKLEEHNKKIEELENKIFKYYQDVNEEVDLIEKLRKSINN